jgi:hypothetical protein
MFAMRTLALLFLVLAALGVWPAAAQAPAAPLDWIPADFAGVLRVDLARPADMLAQLNMASYVASFLQPVRTGAPAQRSLNNYFPVDVFDTEGATFEAQVLPWLTGEIVVGYRALDERFIAAPDDVLLVLPTDDPFAAASALSTVTSAQDFPTRTQYQGVTLFVGDQTAIAFTPAAVLVGSEPLLHAAIDAEAGTAERLADTPAYAALAANSADWPVFAYFAGEAPAHALSALLSSDGTALPLLNALGEALQPYNGGTLETALLSGELDALAVGLRSDPLRNTVRASVTLHAGGVTTAPPDADSDVLTYIPRSAMLMQHGGDVRAALYDALVALPAGGALNALLSSSLSTPATSSGAAPAPTFEPPDAEAITAAVSGFTTAMSAQGGFDLEADLLAHLDGSYAFALLPRPNNPLPGSNAPYDLLLIADSRDAEAAAAGAIRLAQAVLALPEDAFSASESEPALQTVSATPGGEPLLQIGAVDGRLIVGTGNAAALALRAGRGDNPLLSMARWQAVSRDAEPALYLDLNALYATFLPTSGGPVNIGIGQLGASWRTAGDDLYHIDVIVTLPTGT